MDTQREIRIPVTPGSGNVFADLGFEEPEEELTKAQLASHIRRIIKRRRLTQSSAAAVMGIDQPKVSALINGRLANFSSERLMRLLTQLGQDVEITVRAKPLRSAHGRIFVTTGERLEAALLQGLHSGTAIQIGRDYWMRKRIDSGRKRKRQTSASTVVS